ncbi:HTH-type transcriptional regulator LutR [Ciceribacter naphthalenivorans]|uniref:HTH-type transcriptional regulator LutR n=2 Tax=Alphaproteobacteria TaxID=28211 RepID=A0A512HNC1_9HYPH|nr:MULTISPECIES: FCD domain-containing protein [Alphaproteobacteria]GEO86944.1 HTH-type transcriptional regulator LutR [Ciceribacter naphthalenivorans]GLR23286.1 HTH-type transcriptional regulator LutR [Ciceribacter naphthalenivorans]GLT06142.1 HTH-type transcriptional regulator LutR [Sphingomonas psychrolutea]
MNVGRAQVREAMSTLESMRYLERRRGSGVFLCKETDATSLDALVLFAGMGLPIENSVNEQCIEVRRMIEVQAIRMACERRTEKDLARLEDVLALYRDDDAFAAEASGYDFAFHLAIIKATQNEILVRVIHPFYLMSHKRREVFFADRARRAASHAQHIEIVEAIRLRDVDLAEKRLASHIGRVETYYKMAPNAVPASHKVG